MVLSVLHLGSFSCIFSLHSSFPFFLMSTYFGYLSNSNFACVYDSPPACYSDIASHIYSADFYVENRTVPPPSHESAPREPFPLDEEDIRCVFNTGLIHLLPKFHGFAGECPHRHLEEFYTICSSMKPLDVQDEDMFLRAFEYSLHGAARYWWFCLLRGSITSWEDLKHMFLDEFSPL